MLTPSDQAMYVHVFSLAFLTSKLLLREDVYLQLGCSLKHTEAGSTQAVFLSFSLQGRGVSVNDTILIFTPFQSPAFVHM